MEIAADVLTSGADGPFHPAAPAMGLDPPITDGLAAEAFVIGSIDSPPIESSGLFTGGVRPVLDS